jgi:hypothetical protein
MIGRTNAVNEVFGPRTADIFFFVEVYVAASLGVGS